MTSDALGSGVVSQSINGLDSREFRASYMAPGLRAYLADQIRALRGNRSQREFGRLIGKPQSVVSRLENEDYGKLTLQTLLDIALVVRFAEFPTFLRKVAETSPDVMAPAAYSDGSAEGIARLGRSGDKHVSP